MAENEKFDPVNHPKHYKQYAREVIELTEHMDFCGGNACKYILRAPFKGKEAEDLQKAKWYIERMVQSKSVPRIEPITVTIKDDYDCDLFQKVFDIFMDAAMNETPLALKAAVALIDAHLHELEYAAMKEEIKELRRVVKLKNKPEFKPEVKPMTRQDVEELFDIFPVGYRW